jgi:hypothetical protein
VLHCPVSSAGLRNVRTQLQNTKARYGLEVAIIREKSRTAGFYKVTLRYQFDPASVVPIAQMPKEHLGAPGTPVSYPHREILLKTPKIDVSSNVWTVYLAD